MTIFVRTEANFFIVILLLDERNVFDEIKNKKYETGFEQYRL